MAQSISNNLSAWKIETEFLSKGEKRHNGIGRRGEIWAPQRKLGEGGFGQVTLEKCTSGPFLNNVRAVKQISKSDNIAYSRELQALLALSRMDVPTYRDYFVGCYGWFEDDMTIFIAMEYIQHGDLQQHIAAGGLPEVDAAMIALQIAKALNCMHDLGFVHRDLKPANILVAQPGPNWNVKITDFGITKNTEGTALRTVAGTALYMAPELHQPERFGANGYDAAVDIWSLGAVTFCIRTGRPPFLSAWEICDYANDRIRFPTRVIRNSSGALMSFVLDTMGKLPGQRITIEEVLRHDWLQDSKESPTEDGLPSEHFDASATREWSFAPQPQAPATKPPTVKPSTHRGDSGYSGHSTTSIDDMSQKTIRRPPPQPEVDVEHQGTSRNTRRDINVIELIDEGYQSPLHSVSPSKEMPRLPEADLTCLACNKIFTDRDTLFQHLQKMEDNGMSHTRCVRCRTPEELNRWDPTPCNHDIHDAEVGGRTTTIQPDASYFAGNSTMTCLACNETFSCREKLFEHLESMEDEGRGHARCTECGEAEPLERWSTSACSH